MANPFRELFFGSAAESLAPSVEPRRTFADVVLPPATRAALDRALIQIRKHDVIFGAWGLGERHDTGLGLAFNFAGPPGTGKTVCAEAVAHALGKRLLVVRYAELESQWAGATAKNVAAVFREAAEQDAVLFFDEADAIAGRRFTSVDQGYQREANAVVNVLLREVEEFPGVVIFATNLAANFDPAFERRIRTHILFEAPGPGEREQIWRAQIHARKTPLADDVDFAALAARFAGTGGDIKNAVLKAAQTAIAEPGPDDAKRIAQRHFEAAMEEVLGARRVMEQTLFGAGDAGMLPDLASTALPADVEGLEEGMRDLATRLTAAEDDLALVPASLRRLESAVDEARRHADTVRASDAADRAAADAAVRAALRRTASAARAALALAAAALLAALAALAMGLTR